MAKNKQLYFLNQKYQPGMVYQQLLSRSEEEDGKLPIAAVIGIDVGHGECRACIYYKNDSNNWVSEELYCAGKNREIPSYIAYDGDRIVIGNDAKDLSCVITDIKQEPKDWGKTSADGRHTNKKILQDFITVLWKNILSENELVSGILPEQLLVTVGCPASRSWTAPEHMRSYTALIKEATGYPNVVILPESTAAIMTPIYSKLKINVCGGVAVYDLGSSTIDFTYILMGKVMVMASLRLGGYDIDKAMLRKAAKDKRFSLGDANSMEYNTARIRLRRDKEAYYDSGRIPAKKSITVSKELDFCVDSTVMKLLQGHEDKNGALLDLILQSHDQKDLTIAPIVRNAVYQQLQEAREAFHSSGEPVYRSIIVKIPLDYTVDTDMMRCVLEEDLLVSSQLEPPYKGLSWLGCVRKFFEDTFESIRMRGLPCDAVILTGGTSKVTEVRQIADRYYPGKCRGGEADTVKIDTASSVAKGLCLVKGHESQAASQLEGLKGALEEKLRPYYEDFCKGFAREKLFDRVWSLMEDVTGILNDGKEHTKEDLSKCIRQRTVPGSSFEQQIRYDLRRYAREFMTVPMWFQWVHSWTVEQVQLSCSEYIRKIVNEFARDVYQVEAGSLPELPSVLVDSVARTLDTRAIEQVLFSREGTYINYFIERITIDFMHPGFGNTLLQFVSIFQSRLSAGKCVDMAKTLRNQQVKEEQKDSLCWDLRTSLMEITPLREGYDKLMKQQLEVALGVILFELFEEYICLS